MEVSLSMEKRATKLSYYRNSQSSWHVAYHLDSRHKNVRTIFFIIFFLLIMTFQLPCQNILIIQNILNFIQVNPTSSVLAMGKSIIQCLCQLHKPECKITSEHHSVSYSVLLCHSLCLSYCNQFEEVFSKKIIKSYPPGTIMHSPLFIC